MDPRIEGQRGVHPSDWDVAVRKSLPTRRADRPEDPVYLEQGRRSNANHGRSIDQGSPVSEDAKLGITIDLRL